MNKQPKYATIKLIDGVIVTGPLVSIYSNGKNAQIQDTKNGAGHYYIGELIETMQEISRTCKSF